MLHADSRLHGPSDGALPPSAEAVPPVVPGYRVERELGRGGSSRVWLVHPQDGGPARALKVPDGPLETGAVELDHELRAVGELRHDHLVRPHGVVETDQGPGLLNDYLPGGSLGALVRSVGPIPLGQVVTTLVPIAQALAELHTRGVVHGDVSPGNILYDVHGRPALADLGCARLLGGPQQRGGTPGFSPYTSPTSGLRPEDDVFALAAVGWFALTGRAPSATLARAPLTLTLPEIPSSVVSLLEAGLEEDPAERPTAAQFARACYDWAPAEPVDLFGAAHPSVALELPTRRGPAPAGGRHGRPRRAITRRTVVACVASAAALAVSGVAVTLLTAPPGDPGTEQAGSPTVSSPAAQRQPSTQTVPSTSHSAAGPAATPERQDLPAASLDVDDPADAVAALGPARTLALTRRDLTAVDGYTVEGSEAHAQDTALVQRLVDEELEFDGLALEIEPSGPARQGQQPSARGADSSVRVPVEVTISAYTTVSGDGQTAVADAPAPVTEEVELELVDTPAGWRLTRVLPARE